MLNGKKSVSSYQLGRDLGIPQPTAFAMQHRIRKEMGRKTSKLLLHGTIEADETFMGGKPRRRIDKDGNLPPPSPRGSGTKKTKVLEAVERGRKVVARVVTELSVSTIMKFVTSFIRGGSRLVTDKYKDYQPVKRVIKHDVVQRSKHQYVDAEDPSIHTNTIEGFWSLLKHAWHGQYHHYSKKHGNTPHCT
jgi:hypothetical protein